VLDDLLEDWQADYRPVFDGVRVLGHRWSPRSYALRDFLGRNGATAGWTRRPAEREQRSPRRARKLAQREGLKLPRQFFRTTSALSDPSTSELAGEAWAGEPARRHLLRFAHRGWRSRWISGCGLRRIGGLTTVMVEREAPGGRPA